MTKEEINVESPMLKDLWNYRKKFYDVKKDDSFWKEAVSDLEQLSQKYKSKYMDTLLLSCFADMEIRLKEGSRDWPDEKFDYVLKLLRSMQ